VAKIIDLSAVGSTIFPGGGYGENSEPMENDGGAANFHTTHWSLVLAAARRDQAPEGRTALAELCRVYWYPLYAHVRRRGYDPEDAKDLTQGFFLHLIEHEALTQVDSRKGKFRSFLLASLNNFLAVAHRRDNAIKRGGGQELLSLDVADAEGRYRVEPADQLSAEQTFDARWALSLLNESMRQLEESYEEKPQIFEVLKTFLLPGSQAVSYEQAATTLGVSIPAAKTLIYRLRQRYTALLRQEVARTVADQADIDEEIHYLCDVLVKAFGQL
jgi:DNA-directed RNA polymerase specialized sigma24 family protein